MAESRRLTEHVAQRVDPLPVQRRFKVKRGKPLARKTPMKRSPMRRSGRKSKYKRRARDVDFMLWVKKQPCAVRAMMRPRTPARVVSLPAAIGTAHDTVVALLCYGRVQADHAGRRGIGQKADDKTCIPLCEKHHAARNDFTGMFKTWDQAMMRTWLAKQVEETQAEFRKCGALGTEDGHCKRCGLVPYEGSECPPGFLSDDAIGVSRG